MKAMYKGDERYSKVGVLMDLLSIKDVSTTRQEKNGTIVWRLPIKINYPGNAEKFIEVASFKTGYVRNQNCGYSNYQLNKRCDSEPQYYELSNGYYNKYTTRSCVLIPKEIDRLEYLIAYCLKNYYIKNANQVANGKLIPKWTHEYEMNRLQNKLANSVPKWKYDQAMNKNHELDCGQHDKVKELEDRIYELESQVDVADEKMAQDCGHYDRIKELESDVHNLENKLATIERIANDRNKWNG